MPIIVVDQEHDLDAVLARVLTSRASKAAREQAAAALRAANPGIDFTAITTGTVLVIPAFPAARAASGDVVGAALGELGDLLGRGVADLLRVVEQAAESDKVEREIVADVLGSPEIKRASARDPQLKSDIEALRQALDEDAELAEHHLVQVRESVDIWSADLAALRALGTP